jgi:hypothetical protein
MRLSNWHRSNRRADDVQIETPVPVGGNPAYVPRTVYDNELPGQITLGLHELQAVGNESNHRRCHLVMTLDEAEDLAKRMLKMVQEMRAASR